MAVAARAAQKKTVRPSRRKKVVFIVVDGMADTPVNGKTPLSEAKTPNMDWLVANGAVGELDLVKESLAKKLYNNVVWSQVANIALLGLDPSRYYLKRGPLEAVGTGIPYEDGHLAVRCNFATVDRDMNITDRRAGRSSFCLDEIARAVNKGVKIDYDFVFMRTYGHRAVLIIKAPLSDNITSNDPYGDSKALPIVALDPDAEASAAVVQSFIDKSHKVIAYHEKNAERISKSLPPANYILVREAGNRIVKLPDFNKKWNTKAVCISENGVMKATCMLSGFSSVTVPEMDSDKTVDFIFENIESALSEYDFVYAHMKGADEPAHDGNFEKKKAAIEAIDKKLGAFKNFDGIVVVTCDHITSCKSKSHVIGPVPVVVYGRKKDDVSSFSEKTAKEGSLKLMSGRELLKFVFGK